MSLVALSLDHVEALSVVGVDASLWAWTPVRVAGRSDMEAFVREVLEEQRAGLAFAFAIVLRSTGAPIGSTRFMHVSESNRRVEIGGTWIAPAWQRSRVNTESKYLLLCHAFDEWHCRRVEFKAHVQNARSRTALLRIGAVEEGTLRKHIVQADGTSRDSTYFSIVDDEWPAVRARLEERLAEAP
ncbi:MAG: GNAT family N-acetyltransferase [Cytophagaceae bacterium]|nr:GNAT family N-acetyltransferase [Gemmatimonadaceae bacterium]